MDAGVGGRSEARFGWWWRELEFYILHRGEVGKVKQGKPSMEHVKLTIRHTCLTYTGAQLGACLQLDIQEHNFRNI
jgi:hypothetical protein